MFSIHPFNAQESTQFISFSAGHIDAPYAQVMTVESGAGVPRIDFGDGFASATTIFGNTTTDTGHYFQNGSTSSTVTISFSRPERIKEWQYPVAGLNDGIIGELDVSAFTGLWDEFTITGHQNLTGMTLPTGVTTSNEFILFRVQGNKLYGTLNLSGFTNFGRTSPDIMTCQFFANINMTGVTFPSTPRLISLNGRSCDFRSLDFSPMTGIKAFTFNSNQNLTAITFSDSGNTEDINGFDFSDCGFYDLDFTKVADKMGGIIQIDQNYNLSAVTFPQTDLATQINMNSCGFQSDYTVDLTPLRNLGTSIQIRSNNYGDIIFPPTENQITTFLCRDMNQLKHFDISPLSGINTSIQPLECENLTGITFSDAYLYEVTGFNITNDDFRELDMTPLGDKFSNFIYWRQNSFLTAVTFPPTPLGVDDLQGWSCGSLTDLDFSPMSGYGGNIECYSCGNLSAVTFSATTGVTTNLEFQNCDLVEFDLSPLGNSLAGEIRLNSNSNLNSVTFPITSGAVTYFRADNCDLGFVDFRPLSAGTPDGIFINLDDNSTTFSECNQILDSLSGMGAQNGTLQLSGSSASSSGAEGYDTSSGGINGFAIYNDLITNSGWTIFMSGLTS